MLDYKGLLRSAMDAEECDATMPHSYSSPGTKAFFCSSLRHLLSNFIKNINTEQKQVIVRVENGSAATVFLTCN